MASAPQSDVTEYQSQPRHGAWLLATTCVGLLAMTMLFSQLALNGFYEARRLTSLRQVVYSPISLNDVIHDKELEVHFSNQANQESLTPRLVQFASQVDVGNWDTDQFQELEPVLLHTGVISSSTIASMTVINAEMTKAHSELSALEIERASALENRVKVAASYKVVASELEEIVNAHLKDSSASVFTGQNQPSENGDISNETPMRFYSGGILQGLPVFSNLPDSIADETALQRELTQVLGKPSPQKLSRQLTEYASKNADSLKILCATAQEQDTLLSDIREKFDAANAAVQRTHDQAKSLSRDIVFDLVTPVVNERVMKTYRMLRQGPLNVWGDKLPILRAKVKNKSGGFTFL